MKNKNDIEKLQNRNYINLLLEEIKNTTSPLRNCHNYYGLGMAYSQVDEHQKSLNALCEAYTIYNEANFPEKNALYGEIILVSINELIYFNKYQESFYFIDELLHISPDLPDALFYRGICQQFLGKTELAIETYKYTMELLTKSNEVPGTQNNNLNPLGIMSRGHDLIPDLMLKLSSCYQQIGNKKEAFDYLKKLEVLNIWTEDELNFMRNKMAEIEESKWYKALPISDLTE